MKELKNGTDIRGIAVGEKTNLTPQVACRVGKAFGTYLTLKYTARPTVAVGRDPRISGPALRDGLVEGLVSVGVQVLDCGIATTPSMFFSTYYEKSRCHGAVEITASHLPYDRNGLKFFTREGGVDGKVITTLLEMAQANEFPTRLGGSVEEFDLMTPYSQSLVELVRRKTAKEQPLTGIKVVVDAGNGAGGFFAEQVLAPLGADGSGSVFLEPDGTFPNHIPNPENPAAMEACAKATVAAGAHMGICFDTDCDRAAIVDGSGKEINRNRMIALIAALMLREHPGCTIVTDSVTSKGLKAFIEGAGGVHHRFMRGYKKVIDEAIRLEDTGVCAPLAMETSGHGALKENHYLDDGSYLAARLLAELPALTAQGKTLASLIDTLAEPAEAMELRATIKAQDFKTYGARVLQELRDYCAQQGWTLEQPNYEGVRVNFGPQEGDGWFLVRMSLHDPVIPINVESDQKGGARRIADQLYGFLAGFDQLELPKY